MDWLGKYDKIYVGNSKDPELRKNSTSGGVGTQILIDSIKNNIVKKVIVVGMDEKEPWKPKVFATNDINMITNSKGSKYTLIQVNEYLKILNKETVDIGIICLPCHAQVIRNLQKQGKYKNIKFIIGLFCGYNMPYIGTEYLIKKSGIKKKDIIELHYRKGEYPGGFFVKSKKKKAFYPKHYYDIVNLMFVPKGCLACKEYSSELADISLGDAWGHSNKTVIIKRTEMGSQLLKKSNITISEITFDDIFKMHKHNLKHKKIGDSLAMTAIRKFLKSFGKYIPFSLLGKLAEIRKKIIKK